MADTKENILMTALRLFAREGYEAVSVSMIAGELGMTKGALYKHYRNKRDIFDKIVERMYLIDQERAKVYDLPEGLFENGPDGYRDVSVDRMVGFCKAQFDYLTLDVFGSNLRKLLTLEQYRNAEIALLYQNYFASGPVPVVVLTKADLCGDVAEGLDRTFSDVEELSAQCRFHNCSHTTEPDYAVKMAIESGELSPERWRSYQKLKAEIFYVEDTGSYLLAKEKIRKNISKINKSNRR